MVAWTAIIQLFAISKTWLSDVNVAACIKMAKFTSLFLNKPSKSSYFILPIKSFDQMFHYFLLPESILYWWPTLMVGWRKVCLHLKSCDMQLMQNSFILHKEMMSGLASVLTILFTFLAIIFLTIANFDYLLQHPKFYCSRSLQEITTLKK